MKSKSKLLLIAVAVILVLIILAYVIDLKTVLELMRSADSLLILLSVIFMIAGFILVSVRLRFILGGQISFRQTFYGDALGFMTTPFLPLPTPVLRAIGIQRTTPLNASLVSPALAIDYLLGMVMRVLALIFVIFLIPSSIDSTWSVVGSILLVMILFGGLIWLVNHLDRAFDALARWLSVLPRIEEQQVRYTLGQVHKALEAAGSTRSLLISLLYTLVILLSFALYHYLAWAAFPLDLGWRQMLALSMAVIVVVPPTAPFMIGVYQGAVVGVLIFLRILDVNILTAYAILAQAMQIVFWVIIGVWVLFRTKISLRELIRRTEKLGNDN